MQRFVTLLAASALLLGALAPGLAEVPAKPQPDHGAQAGEAVAGSRPESGEASRPGQDRSGGATAGEGRRLPPDSVTRHVLELPGGQTLRFTATAGSVALDDDQGKVQAEIGYVAYTVDDAEAASRPVAFVVNGGPGASSAYLHLGAIGPWRLPFSGPSISPSAPPAVVPNAETWLDFADLVFIDPVSTGYSRANGSNDEIRNRYFSVEGDIAELSSVILRWLKAKDRMQSPKFFIGESYGGFRGPLIAQKLGTDYGAALSGLVLVSPVLDFGWFNQQPWAPFIHVGRLPSYAAAALETKGRPVTREGNAEAERYAAGDYLVDLTRGLKDKEAVERVSARVAGLTGLDPDLVRRYAGRIEPTAFQREFRRSSGRIASAYDTGVTSYDPTPTAHATRVEDPGLSTLTAPLTSAIVDHLSRRLNYRVDGRYELLNGSVNSGWRWGNGRHAAESVNELREMLALDPKVRVLVAHGFTDLVTPYFTSKLILDQLPDYGPDKRLELGVYPGGHMFYSRESSRIAFRDDARRMFEEALKARESRPEH